MFKKNIAGLDAGNSIEKPFQNGLEISPGTCREIAIFYISLPVDWVDGYLPGKLWDSFLLQVTEKLFFC